MPDLEVYLHRSREECNGGLGLYHAGRIDLCTEESSEPYQRKFALHEMAHGWIEANVDGAVLDRFMDIRGIAAWNDQTLRLEAAGHRAGRRDHHLGTRRGRDRSPAPETGDPETLARSTGSSRLAIRSRLPRPDDSPDGDDPPSPNHRSELPSGSIRWTGLRRTIGSADDPAAARSCRRCGGANDARGVDARHPVLGRRVPVRSCHHGATTPRVRTVIVQVLMRPDLR